MKPTLQLKLSQHLTLTPQLQQSIKLLQLSTIELNQEIERALLENPLLEREEDTHADAETDSAQADDAPPETTGEADSTFDNASDYINVSSGSTSQRDDDDDNDFQSFHGPEITLHEHLDQQVALVRWCAL